MSDAPVLSELNHVTDLDAASDFEKKHTPYIEADRTDGGVRVTVKIGHYVSHPNDPDHFIQWIEVIAGDKQYRQFLHPNKKPEAMFPIKNSEITLVREYCNVHGLWKA